jgi:hypothetical protein
MGNLQILHARYRGGSVSAFLSPFTDNERVSAVLEKLDNLAVHRYGKLFDSHGNLVQSEWDRFSFDKALKSEYSMDSYGRRYFNLTKDEVVKILLFSTKRFENWLKENGIDKEEIKQGWGNFEVTKQ